MSRNEVIFDAICNGNRNKAKESVQCAVDDGSNVELLLTESMIPAMREIGDRFARNEAFIPQMLLAARAMQEGLAIIEPLLIESGHEPRGKVAVGSVEGDLHDIGKNLVVMMLKGAGFEVDDLGVDCKVERFHKAVTDGSKVICCSALLTTTMQNMKNVVDSFAEKNDVKVIIGGAPITQEFADTIGADGYGKYATDVTKLVCESMNLEY